MIPFHNEIHGPAAMTDPSADRTAHLIAAYGADPERWPADARALAARVRAEASPALRDARALDAELALLQPVPAPASGLRRQILLAAAREPRSGTRGILELLAGLWRELGGARIAAPALALAIAAGIGLGWDTGPMGDADEDGEDLLLLAQFDENYSEFLP
jgi:hypothetical protein